MNCGFNVDCQLQDTFTLNKHNATKYRFGNPQTFINSIIFFNQTLLTMCSQKGAQKYQLITTKNPPYKSIPK